MAIYQMVGKEKFGQENVTKVTDYPGHEEGLVRHHRNCPNFAANGGERQILPVGQPLPDNCLKNGFNERCDGPFEAIYLEKTFENRVIDLGENNFHDDSDFYAVVWDDTEQKPKNVYYGTTRGWTYPNKAHIDADTWTLAKYSTWKRKQELKRQELLIEKEKQRIAKGKTLKVVSGRKVAIGTTGECIWLGNSDYGQRVGIKDISGVVHWTYAKNCAVVV